MNLLFLLIQLFRGGKLASFFLLADTYNYSKNLKSPIGKLYNANTNLNLLPSQYCHPQTRRRQGGIGELYMFWQWQFEGFQKGFYCGEIKRAVNNS